MRALLLDDLIQPTFTLENQFVPFIQCLSYILATVVSTGGIDLNFGASTYSVATCRLGHSFNALLNMH